MPYLIARNPDNDYHRLERATPITVVDGRRVEFKAQMKDIGGTERLLASGNSTSNAIAVDASGSTRFYVGGVLNWGDTAGDVYNEPVVIGIEKQGTVTTLDANGVDIASYDGPNNFELRFLFFNTGQGPCAGDFYWLTVRDNGVLTQNYLPDPADGTSLVDSMGVGDAFTLSNYQANPYVLYHAIESVDLETFAPGQKVTLTTSAGFNPNTFTLDDGTKSCSPDLVSESAADTYSFTLPLGNIEGFPDFGNVTATLSNGSETATALLTMAVPAGYTLQQLNAGILRDETTVSWQFPSHPSGGAFYLYDAAKLTVSQYNELSILAGETYTTTAYLIDGAGLQEFVISEPSGVVVNATSVSSEAMVNAQSSTATAAGAVLASTISMQVVVNSESAVVFKPALARHAQVLVNAQPSSAVANGSIMASSLSSQIIINSELCSVIMPVFAQAGNAQTLISSEASTAVVTDNHMVLRQMAKLKYTLEKIA